MKYFIKFTVQNENKIYILGNFHKYSDIYSYDINAILEIYYYNQIKNYLFDYFKALENINKHQEMHKSVYKDDIIKYTILPEYQLQALLDR